MISPKYPIDYKNIIPYMNNGDIIFANLECPITDKEKFIKDKEKILFRCSSEIIDTLKDINVNIVSLANNHTFDCNYKGMVETIQLLKEADIKHTGAGSDIFEARTPVIFEVNNQKIGFLSYSWTKKMVKGPPEAMKGFPGVAPQIPTIMKEDIYNLKDKVNFIVISLHSGEENTLFPLPELKQTARKLIDWGADLIIGSHPHTFQGYEIYKDKLIFYSLGNFIFSNYEYIWKGNKKIRKWDKINRESSIVKIFISGNKDIQFELIPILQKMNGKIEIMEGDRKVKFLLRIERLAKLYSLDNYYIFYPLIRRLEELIYKTSRMLKIFKQGFKNYGSKVMVKEIFKYYIPNVFRVLYRIIKRPSKV